MNSEVDPTQTSFEIYEESEDYDVENSCPECGAELVTEYEARDGGYNEEITYCKKCNYEEKGVMH